MTTKKTTSKKGKAVNIWLRPGDLKRIRELVTFISKHHRASDSAIISAALRIAKPNNAFLKSFEDGSALDARRKRVRTDAAHIR